MTKLDELTVTTALLPVQVVLPATLKLVTSGIAFTVAATEASPRGRRQASRAVPPADADSG